MNLFAKLAIGVLAFIGLLVVGVNLFLPHMNVCESVLIRSAQSPNSTYVAKISSSTCDDPANSGTSVYIHNSATGEAHGILAFNNSSTDFELTWSSDHAVTVIYPRTVELVARSREINEVSVRFLQR